MPWYGLFTRELCSQHVSSEEIIVLAAPGAEWHRRRNGTASYTRISARLKRVGNTAQFIYECSRVQRVPKHISSYQKS